MYRPNISNVLYPLAGVLGLFIVYETSLKPAYVHSPVPLQTGHDSSFVDTGPEPPRDAPQEPAPKQLRVIESGGIPDTKYHESLDAIHDEIEKGNLKEAETEFAGLPVGID